MQLKTILNRIEPFKSFVYGKARMLEEDGELAIEVEVQARANGRAICSGCGRPGPGYDRLPERRFEFVPLWGIAVFFVYAMRRVDCPQCGVTVERVPWAEGKSHLTTSYRWFLARWAKRLSWEEVARVFHTTWEHVFRSVKHAVFWGLAHRRLGRHRGHRRGRDPVAAGAQLPDVGVSDRGGVTRLLWVAKERTTKTLLRFFRMLGTGAFGPIRFVCSDMWQPYLKVIAKKAGQAVHVLDRFHIMKKMNKAIDEVRAAEAKRLERDGYEPVLKHSRWCLLKRPENRTEKQTVKLSELLQYNLQSFAAICCGRTFSGSGSTATRPGRRSSWTSGVPARCEQDRADEEDGQDVA